MLGNEEEVARAVDRALYGLGDMRKQGHERLRESDVREGLRRAAMLRHIAFRATVRKLVSRKRKREGRLPVQAAAEY